MMKFLIILLLVVLLIQIQSFIYNNKLLTSTSTLSLMKLYMKTKQIKPITYTSIDIFKTTLLIKDNDEKDTIMNIITKWDDETKVDDNIITEWENSGLAFRLNDDGMNAIELAEKEEISSNIIKEFPNRAMYNTDMFINIGSEKQPIFIKTSCSSFIPDILSGKISIQSFIEKGDAFTNVKNLFIDGEINRKADYIANRVTTEFNNTSPEWKRWTNMTSQYNATSLTQAMYEFFDITSDNNYSPKPDYPGTFAPGDTFIDQYQVSKLANHILHPWPAMQELKFSVRWPPNHPAIFPPPLWIALNNMYTGNFSAILRSEAGTLPGFEPTEALGGNSMEAKDALRIADFATFGESYEISEQLKHGGMAFDRGQKIPNYNPDHVGTVPSEESSLDDLIPEELLKFQKRWLDPYFGMDTEVIQTTLSEELQEEADNEEALRRAAAERLLNQMQSAKWESTEQQVYQKMEAAKLENLADMAERAAKSKKEFRK